MAKEKVHSAVLALALIYHHPRFNVARLTGDYGSDSDKKKILQSLVSQGWLMNGDGTIEVEAITKEWKEEAVKDLTDRWEALKARAAADSKNLPALHVFEAVRTRKNKLIVPEYMGVSGNRRCSVVDEANLIRYTAVPTIPLIEEVPAIVRIFDSEKDRIVAQVQENLAKLQGFAKPSDKDNILSAQAIMAKGGTQSDLRRAFTDTTGQKLYGIVTLDRRFPKVRLIERIIKTDPTHPDFLRYGNIKGAALPNLVLRSDQDALAKHNTKEESLGKQPLAPLSAETLEKFLTDQVGVNEPKIMEKKNIDALKANNPNTVVQAVAKAIMENNSDPLNPFIVHANAYNALGTLTAQVGPDIEAILTALTRASDLSVAIKNVRNVLKV